MPDIASALVFYVVFLFSITVHEAAHAWAAKLGGDLTAYHGGQVTLDPRPHIKREPVGMVILPLATALLTGWPFGFASAPYDPRWAMQYPKRAAWMALAGPASNLVLVIIAAAAIRIGVMADVFQAPISVRFSHLVDTEPGGLLQTVGLLLSVFFSLNLVLLALNMIPLPPLDGSGALPLLLSREATAKYQRFIWSSPALSFVGIFVAWQLFDVIFHPVFLFAVNLLWPGLGYA